MEFISPNAAWASTRASRRVQFGAQRGEHRHPLLDVEALQPPDLPARLLGQPVQFVQVQGDDGRIVQAKSTWKSTSAASAAAGSSGRRRRPVPVRRRGASR